MTKEEEQAYELGRRVALTQILRSVFRDLGHEDTSRAALLLEREAAIASLRSVCRDHGDNEWDSNLHLADVIEKHLGRYLESDGTDPEKTPVQP